ncbi:MAG: hypothetical protein Q9187_006276 [Circinaria calcarea]
MNDPNVLAVLTPCRGSKGDNASRAFSQPHNAARYQKAAGCIAEEPTIGSRDPTLSPSGGDIESIDRMVLKFSDLVNNLAKGLQFGTNTKTSDILLKYRGVRGISALQFVFVVQEDGSWYLEDFFSTFGTAVSYDGKAGNEKRQKERWIIAHPPRSTKEWKELIVYAGTLAFNVDFPNQEAGRPEYVAKLEAFIKENKKALPPVDALGLNSNPITTAPSEPRTPYQCSQPIYIDYGEIGRGSFAVVHKVMSNRDGKFYAMKKFSRPSKGTDNDDKKRKREQADWYASKRKEADIMSKNAHPNVMPVIESVEEPGLFIIIMPYYKLGNLQEYNPLDKPYTYGRALLQILLALSWLHSRGVVHRDIKPENFLIEAETPLNIIIADFGLSNLATDHLLKTFCGTYLYCAPEVYPGNSDGYGPKADIWSLGVMMLRLMYRLPDTPDFPRVNSDANLREWVKLWSTRLREELTEWTDDYDLVMDLLFNMIKANPEERYTADQCLLKGLRSGLFRKSREGYIIGANDREVDTPAEVAWQTDSSKNGSPQSPRLAETATSNHSLPRSILTEKLWEGSTWNYSLGAHGKASVYAHPSTDGSNSGPPTRRRRISHTSSWSLTIGLGNSNSVGGFNLDEGPREEVATGLFIRKNHFTASLESQLASGNEPQEESTGVGQGSPALPEPDQETAEPVALASFEQRILQLQA